MSTEFEDSATKSMSIRRALGQGLETIHDHPDADVDIVAVPGLGANPHECWTWDSSAQEGTASADKARTPETVRPTTGPNKTFNWIKDEHGLAYLFPRSRIMLYNYASAWRGKRKVRASMKGICTWLLDDLHDRRKNGSETRPLIFIAHSMGGIVVAKTLCIARSHKEWDSIVTHTTGCAFFGAPFRGSDMAKIALMYSSIFGNEAYESLVLLMRPENNDALDEVTGDFMEICNKLTPPMDLVCIWEQNPTVVSYSEKIAKILPGLLQQPILKAGVRRFMEAGFPVFGNGTHFVEKESAVLQGAYSIGMTAGHSDLIKFESVTSTKFGPVRSALTRMIQSARPVARKRALFSRDRLLPQRFVNQVRQSLEGIDMRSKFRLEVDSQQITSWLTSEPLYRQWLKPAGPTDSECRNLWLKGGPGLGKTRASLAAIQELSDIHANRRPIDAHGHSEASMAYFLCDRYPVRSTAEDVLKNLIIQLINQDESLAQHARWFVPNPNYRGPAHLNSGKTSSDNDVLGAKATATVENLWKCLHDMVNDSVVNSIHFVISNIHNLNSGASTKALLSELAKSTFSSELWPSARVKWLLTSRNDAHICEVLSASSLSIIDLENDNEYGKQVKIARQSHARDAIARLGSAKNYSRDLTYYVRNFVKGQSEDEKWIDILCILLQARPNDSDLSIRKWLRNAGKFSVPELVKFAWDEILDQNQESMLEIEELMQVLTIAYEPPTLQDVAVLAHIDEVQKLVKLIEKCSPILHIGNSGEHKGRILFTNAEFRKEIAIISYGEPGVPSQQKKRFHGLMALRCFKHIRAYYDFSDDPDYVPEPPTNLLSPSTIAASRQNEAVNQVAMLHDDFGEADSISSRLSRHNCVYPTRHLFRHLSEGPPDAAQELCEDDPYFWGESSSWRDQWLQHFQALATEFRELNMSGMSALHVAAGIGATDLLGSFVDRNGKQSLSWMDEDGKTPLHVAAYNNHPESVETLIRAGAQIEAGEGEAGTPLHLAALRGHCSIMEHLIDKGANVNALSKPIGPVINAAIRSGTVKAVKLIIDQNVHFDADYTKCDPPLSLSAGISDPEVFKEILESGKHKWLQNAKLLDQALIAAAYSGRSLSLRILLEFEHTYINNTLETAILSAALEKNWTPVEDLLDYVKNQTSQGKRRGIKLDDAFYLAATSREAHRSVLEKIWTSTNNAIPEELLDFSLYQAAVLNKRSTVDWLLDVCGASANATAERPRSVNVDHDNALVLPGFSTALNAAAGSGSVEIVKSLIRKGAEVDGNRVYALQLAASEGHDKVVQVLLEHGALVNKQLPNSEELGFFSGTALQAACDNKRERIVDTLLRNEADPNLGGGPFTNPITAATQKNEPEILRLLLCADGIKVNVTGGEDLSTPLINAAEYMSVESVELLAKCGADIDARNAAGETALIMAAGRGDTVCVEMLCDKGADVTYRSPRRGLAIAAAADGLHPLCVRLLADKMCGKIETHQERAKIDPSKERLDEVLAEIESRDASIVSLKATLADTEEQLESSNAFHQHEIQKLLTARSIQGENYESASQQVKAMQSERMEIQKQLDAARGHERHSNVALEKVENMLKHERQINAALRKRQELDALQERLNDAHNSLGVEKQQGLMLQDNVNSLRKTIADMETKVASARADTAGVLQQLTAEQKSKEVLKEEMKTLENRYRELVMDSMQEQPRLRDATSSGSYIPYNVSDAAIDRDYLRRHSGRTDSGRAYGSPLMGPTPVASPQPEVPVAMSPRMQASGSQPNIRNPGSATGFKTIHGQHRPDGSMGGYRKDRMLRMRSDDTSDVLLPNEQDRELKLSPQSSISDNRSAT